MGKAAMIASLQAERAPLTYAREVRGRGCYAFHRHTFDASPALPSVPTSFILTVHGSARIRDAWAKRSHRLNHAV